MLRWALLLGYYRVVWTMGSETRERLERLFRAQYGS